MFLAQISELYTCDGLCWNECRNEWTSLVLLFSQSESSSSRYSSALLWVRRITVNPTDRQLCESFSQEVISLVGNWKETPFDSPPPSFLFSREAHCALVAISRAVFFSLLRTAVPASTIRTQTQYKQWNDIEHAAADHNQSAYFTVPLLSHHRARVKVDMQASY